MPVCSILLLNEIVVIPMQSFAQFEAVSKVVDVLIFLLDSVKWCREKSEPVKLLQSSDGDADYKFYYWNSPFDSCLCILY